MSGTEQTANGYEQHHPAGYAVSVISRELLSDPPRAGLFLDFDGTLAPLGGTIDDVEVPDSLRRWLERLAAALAAATAQGAQGNA
jgi:hypothetical protein